MPKKLPIPRSTLDETKNRGQSVHGLNFGALLVRMGFWDTFWYNYRNKEP